MTTWSPPAIPAIRRGFTALASFEFWRLRGIALVAASTMVNVALFTSATPIIAPGAPQILERIFGFALFFGYALVLAWVGLVNPASQRAHGAGFVLAVVTGLTRVACFIQFGRDAMSPDWSLLQANIQERIVLFVGLSIWHYTRVLSSETS